MDYLSQRKELLKQQYLRGDYAKVIGKPQYTYGVPMCGICGSACDLVEVLCLGLDPNCEHHPLYDKE